MAFESKTTNEPLTYSVILILSNDVIVTISASCMSVQLQFVHLETYVWFSPKTRFASKIFKAEVQWLFRIKANPLTLIILKNLCYVFLLKNEYQLKYRYQIFVNTLILFVNTKILYQLGSCLYQISWHSIQYFWRPFTQNQKFQPHSNTREKIRGSPKKAWFHPLGTKNVWISLHDNLSSICQDISVWTEVVDRPTDWHCLP